MNKIIRTESAIDLFGQPARAFNVIADDATGRIINQTIKTTRYWRVGTVDNELRVELRFDDQCGNGHESFAITADHRLDGRENACGCLHEEIADRCPELAHLIRWHLTSTDGPMHYIANTVFHSGDRDCHGLRKGEFGAILTKHGSKQWHIPFQPAYDITHAYIVGDDKPPAAVLEYELFGRTGEGKARDFAAARSCAVWPEATDAQLSLPAGELKLLLVDRLPALLARFKADMLACGFLWPERVAP